MASARSGIILTVILLAAGASGAEPDPFAWLEKGDDPAVGRWVAGSDGRAKAFLDALPQRARLRKRIVEIVGAGEVLELRHRGRRLFYLKRTGAGAQPKLFVHDPADDEPRVVLDPDAISPGGRLLLEWWTPSHDGLLLAYGLADAASGEPVLRVREVDSASDLPDRIPRAPRASVAWRADRTGFYYTRHPAPGEVPPEELAYHRRVYFHRLGTDPLEDPLVFGADRPKEDWPEVETSPDGLYLVVTVRRGTLRTEVYGSKLTASSTDFFALSWGESADFEPRLSGDTLYMLTNDGAPRGRIVAADLRKPYRLFGRNVEGRSWDRKQWRLVVPEGPFTIVDFTAAGRMLAVHALERGASRLRLHDRDGRPLAEIPLPGPGSIRGLAGHPGSDKLFVLHESFLSPPAIFRWDLAASSLSILESPPAPVATSAFEVRAADFPSRDGTRVPVFLVHKKGLRKDRRAPAIVAACGALGIRSTPSFAGPALAWLEAGGLLAVPSLRGGGEYGFGWRREGILDKRQNSYDDLAAAARWLVEQEYTGPDRLAAAGEGHCALAAAAVLAQSPELFRAAALSGPLTDLLAFPRRPPGLRWVSEYGSPDDRAQRHVLARLSPYGAVLPSRRYPAVLIEAGAWDREVDPAHGRAMAAKLGFSTSSGLPVLFRLRQGAGGRACRTTGSIAEEALDRYAFFLAELGVP